MLPSAGFFATVTCPFHARGFCERPFCPFRHDDAAELSNWKIQGGGKAPLPLCKEGCWVTTEKNSCFLELERINKEIETVKCEVEKEQRRLSHYQTFQEDCAGNGSSNDLNLHNGLKELQPKSAVEFPKPTCDGEERQNLKRTRKSSSENQSGSRTDVDSDEEGVLIIDIPALEEHKKRPRSTKCKTNTKVLLERSEIDVPVPLMSEVSASTKPDLDVLTSAMESGYSNCADSAIVNQGDYGKGKLFEDVSQCLEKLESKKMAYLPEHELVKGSKMYGVSECSGLISTSWPEKTLLVKHTSTPPSKMETVIQNIIPADPFDKDYCLQQKPVTSRAASEALNDEYSSASALKAKHEEQQDTQQAIPSAETTWVPVLPGVSCDQKTVTPLNFAGALLVGTGDHQTADHQTTNQLTPTNVQQIKQLAVTNYQGADIPAKDYQPIYNQPVASTDVFQPISKSLTSTLQPASCDFGLYATQPNNIPGNANQAIGTGLSSEEDNCSDVELSDSDPMEECYRIFMEANQTEPAQIQNDIQTETVVVEKTEMEKKPLPVSGPKKRVAHVSKHELEQKATVAMASVKGGQTFTTVTSLQKNLENVTPSPSKIPVQTSKCGKLESSERRNACVNILPVGATIQWANVHFILPEGTIALPLSSVPTPPSASSIHSPMPLPQHPIVTPAKPLPQPAASKRRPKVRPEASTKVPHDLRQRYVNLFVEEFLKTSFTVQDAFEKALAEEKTIYDRSINKLKYLSVAVNVLKRLKNQCVNSPKTSTEATVLGSRGHISLSPLLLLTSDTAVVALYNQLKDYTLSEALLKENNYAFAHPDIPGRAIQYGSIRKGGTDSLKKICCRCGATFSVSLTGTYTRKEECNYHYGKVVENKVPGGVETRYSCCEGAVGTPGCQVFKLHVHDALSLDGFVRSIPSPSLDNGCPGVFALDCEMCYTTKGLELARVTVVNPKLQVIYDTFVKPDSEVIDYNTRFTGISEEDLSQANSSISDIQTSLLSFINADTILIGHNLQNDLCALKLVHSTVVDTAVVFPHCLGFPHKRALHSLVADHLRRIIQSVSGHDSGEDAIACMELMLWKVKEDSKGKRL
ncbi:RNA exonuclease 1 homolog [Scleropages formosus]|uniref:RNA exonuclease 1 homolog n=1 Tax=Scleropages formosus TaxID=113540 RepID=UPI0010FA8624|nr:RNA exonuclease 1 homolog [Scleropages formosus]